jgi:hypothetical protein
VIKAYSSSTNVSYDGAYNYSAELAVDRRISRMSYLAYEDSFFRDRVYEVGQFSAKKRRFSRKTVSSLYLVHKLLHCK